MEKFEHDPFLFFDEKNQWLQLIVDSRFNVTQDPVFIEEHFGEFKGIVKSSEVFKSEKMEDYCQFYTLCFSIGTFEHHYIYITLDVMVTWQTLDKGSRERKITKKEYSAGFDVVNCKWVIHRREIC